MGRKKQAKKRENRKQVKDCRQCKYAQKKREYTEYSDSVIPCKKNYEYSKEIHSMRNVMFGLFNTLLCINTGYLVGK